jgi:sugar/nucleoside kinase (ribokinase family)
MKTKSTNKSILIVGSVALDDIDGPFGNHPDLLGGSASFISRAAAYFTHDVSVVAVVGDDFPQQYITEMSELGIDTSGIERKAGETFHWAGRYSPDLSTRETLDTRLGVFATFQPHVAPQHRKADLVFLGNIHPTLQRDVLEQTERPSLVALDTMNFWIGGHRAELLKTLARVNTLLVNDEEARQLAEEHNLCKAAARILEMGPTSVVIKRGDAGALLFYQGGVFGVPALPLPDVRDPTGAGDSFAGGFMGYLAYAGDLEPRTVRTAMIVGSVMASFAVEKFSVEGLRGLTRDMIQGRFDQFAELTHFEQVRL